MSARRPVGLLAAALAAAAVGAAPSPAAPPRATVTVHPHVRALDDGTLKVTFEATAKLPVAAYRWSFGDPRSHSANVSSDSRPMHVYARGKVYRVRLQVVFGGGRRAFSTYLLRL